MPEHYPDHPEAMPNFLERSIGRVAYASLWVKETIQRPRTRVTKPFIGKPADTEYEYVFPFSHYRGSVDPSIEGVRQRLALREGRDSDEAS